MKKTSLHKLFILMGWKVGWGKVSKDTAQGKYCHLMWDMISDPNVSVYEAQMWVAKHKDEVDKLFKGE
jgi:hypothetical protein